MYFDNGFEIPTEEFCAYHVEEKADEFENHESYKHDVELFFEAYKQLEELF